MDIDESKLNDEPNLEKDLTDDEDLLLFEEVLEENIEEELIKADFYEEFEVDDPVRMYLKEIGNIPLLNQ